MENRKIILSDNGTVIVPSETKMSISEIADLFGIYYQTIKKLIRDIEKQRSTERSVVKSSVAGGDYSGSCTCEGSKIYPDYYGLEMVVVVAFRVQSVNAEVFRGWLLKQIGIKALQIQTLVYSKNISLN